MRASRLVSSRPILVILRILFGIGILAVWQGLIHFGVVKEFVLPSPRNVVLKIHDWIANGDIWPQVEPTLVTLGVGLGFGMLGGVIVGVLSGTVPFIRHYLSPFVALFNAVPRLVLIPFFIGWFGFGYTAGMIVTGLEVVFLVIITVQAGIAQIHGKYILSARMLGAGWSDLLRTVYLPGVALWTLSAARVSVGLAFQAAVVTEFFGSPRGIGFLILEGETTLNATQLYAAIALTAILAYILDVLLKRFERRFRRWDVQA